MWGAYFFIISTDSFVEKPKKMQYKNYKRKRIYKNLKSPTQKRWITIL
jgi:hypothetical protein